LLVQRCSSCGSHQHYPRPICLGCGRDDGLSFVPSDGLGTVWSFTEVHRAPAPDVAVPYTVALVALAEGPVLLTQLAYDDPRCDDAVRLDWRPIDDGRHLPVFVKRD
jgi:uncharacterized OB-fold protein